MTVNKIKSINSNDNNSNTSSLAQLYNPPLEIDPFLSMAIQSAIALDELHSRNILCGNISPDRIQMNIKTKKITIDTSQTGSSPAGLYDTCLTYVSPEQTGRMNCPVDIRTDIYSLGVVFYEFLTGNPPFVSTDPLELVYFHLARTAVSPSVIRPAVPPVLSEIVMKLIAKAPEERYQTASGLKSDLQECLDQWRNTSAIKPFKLGQYDIPDHPLIPQKLYGRE